MVKIIEFNIIFNICLLIFMLGFMLFSTRTPQSTKFFFPCMTSSIICFVLALLLLYDVTNQNSFDNIRVCTQI